MIALSEAYKIGMLDQYKPQSKKRKLNIGLLMFVAGVILFLKIMIGM
ncbi:hypothetical protein HOK51_01395, partial [Candidatus Woesearchaeota archaeon]|nr:hypothetical protein [Candidatus Woesearchaeota archaeon]